MAQPPERSDKMGPGPFRIHVAAELSGVPAATLRAWERRYGVPVPRRTASAYRLYAAEDVEQVTRMRELVGQGVSPAEAARIVRAGPAPLALETSPAAADGLELARSRLLAGAQRFDAAAIDGELARLSMLLDAITFYERVVSPLLVEVGRRWEAGTLSVAQEHLLSDRVEYALRAALRTLERSDAPLALFACIDQEQHVLGMLGAALKFAASGARVVVLGAMTPPSAIADAVRSMAPRMVGLSACLVPPSSRALMRAYGGACETTRWVVGGTSAGQLRAAVEAAGGQVAVGAAVEWQGQVREWLRGSPGPTDSRPSGSGGGRR
jgi:MerR family transcriptional regulator, light-induced transcriptional regulator